MTFIIAKESSLSFEGVGRLVRSWGGGMGRFGPGGPMRPDAEENALGPGGRIPPALIPPIDPCIPRGGPWNLGGPRGGGVIARRVTG